MASFCYRCMQKTVQSGRCTSCGALEVKRSEGDVNLLPLGTKLDHGNVIIGDKLGAGGFGITYIARDAKYGLIALKEFMPRYMIVGKRKGIALAIDEEKRPMYEKCLSGFRREAKVLNDLRHPNIVRVLFEMEEQGTAYYGMELLQGCNLAQWLKNHGQLSPAEACRLLLPIMDALIHTHSRGVLHRDISPDNIFLRNAPGQYMDVSPCLIDFGAAYIAMEDYTHTVPNVKKKGYSPPDQNVDVRYQGPRIDVYAFAATMYYVLTGTVPPPASDRMDGFQDLIPPHQLNPQVSAEVSLLLMSGMELNSQKRIQTMTEFRNRFCVAVGLPVPKPISPQPIPPEPAPAPTPIPDTPVPAPAPAPAATEARWKYLVSLLIEAIIYIAIPEALLSATAPWIGLTLGVVLMYVVNLLLCKMQPGLTLGQRILDISGVSPLTNVFLYNLVRCILPVSLLDEAVVLAGLTQSSFTERTFRRQTPAIDVPDPTNIGKTGVISESVPDIPSESAAYLTCCDKSRNGERFTLSQKQRLGRDAAKCDIVLSHTDRTLSSWHCTIGCSDAPGKGRTWYISDNKSTNGTFVNGKKLPSDGDKLTPIKNGDKITIGSEDYIFRTK